VGARVRSCGAARAAVLWALAAVLAGAGVFLVIRLRRADEPAAPQSRVSGPFVAPPPIAPSDEPPPDIRYVDVTAAAGIDFVHETGARGRKLLPETMGAGCAFFDYDGDGKPDLLLLNGDYWSDDPRRATSRPTSKLYRNEGNWKFTDVTKAVGLDAPFYAMGCSAADTDGDGDLDLFISGVGGYRFYRNDGGKFVETSAEAGLVPGTWKDPQGREHGCFATSCAFVDYDCDGLPDLFVCHYVRWSEETDVWSTMDGKTKSYAIPTQYQGETCRLWKNLGGNRFKDMTDAAHVRNDEGKSLGVCILDLDDDGYPDIAVSNDTQPNYLYRNEKDGTFTDIGLAPAGIAYGPDGRARAGMGIDAGELANDGRQAIAIANFSGEPVSLFEQRAPKDCILVNKADVYGVAVVTHPVLKFGLLILDADQDGWNDLVLANGHIEPTVQSVHKETPYAQPMQLLRNLKGKRFVDVSKSIGPDFTVPRVGRGLAYADVDGDGDLDLCETVNGGRPALLRCDGPVGKALRVDVVDGKSTPLGAKVTVARGDRTTSQRIHTGGSYLSLCETTLTFAVPGGVPVPWIEVAPVHGPARTFEGPFAPGAVRLDVSK
jgi:hypothetical protein